MMPEQEITSGTVTQAVHHNHNVSLDNLQRGTNIVKNLCVLLENNL